MTAARAAIVLLYPPGFSRHANRSLEWYLACLDILFGLLVLAPMWNTMEPNIYAPLLNFIPYESVWGGLLIARGVGHGIALYINGRRWWTPYVRAAASATSAFFWAAFVLTIMTADNFVPGLVFSLGVANVVAHGQCIGRSAKDAGLARACAIA